MKHYVLTFNQKLWLEKFLLDYKDYMSSKMVSIVPIEIKGDLFIIPENCFYDDVFLPIKSQLLAGNHLKDVLLREVEEWEYLTWEDNEIGTEHFRMLHRTDSIEMKTFSIGQAIQKKKAESISFRWKYWFKLQLRKIHSKIKKSWRYLFGKKL